MKLTCAKCGRENPVQKFCGDCGEQLLSTGTEISTDDGISVVSYIKEDKRRVNIWWIAGAVCVLTWILGGAIFYLFMDYNGYDERYASLYSLVIGVVFMILIVFSSKER